MDSEILPTYVKAVIEKCQLCESGTDARYFCNDCQEGMCKQCKSIHLRSKLGRNHTIASIARETEEENQEVCSQHPQEQVQMYCSDCDLPVCHTCIADKKHQSHRFDTLSNIIDQCRKDLSKFLMDRKHELSELETSLKSVWQSRKEYDTQFDDTITYVNKRRDTLKSQIDTTADDIIEEAHIHKNRDIQIFETQCDDISRTISDKKAKIESCEEMLVSGRGASIIQLAVAFKQGKEELNVGPPKIFTGQIAAPKFASGKPVNFQVIFGDLELIIQNEDRPEGKSENYLAIRDKSPPKSKSHRSIDKTIMADIDPCIRCPCISAVNDQEAWVAKGFRNGSKIALINLNGQVKKWNNEEFTIYDIAATPEGDLLVTDVKGCRIRQYTQHGSCTDLAVTAPFEPFGICMTSDNDILVCLRGKNSNRIARMTRNGQVIQTITQDQHKKDLFKYPRLISENINGDICVVDGDKTVVVVDKDGVLRFTYPDAGQTSRSLQLCYGIACDKFGFILISDHGNHLIHQIDSDGRFLLYILTQQDGIYYPWELTLDSKGKLWICNENANKVIVLKFES